MGLDANARCAGAGVFLHVGERFAPDGESFVYTAAWEGGPVELFLGRQGSTEARPLSLNDARILAISRSGEMALLLGSKENLYWGTLAQAPLAGGAPRVNRWTAPSQVPAQTRDSAAMSKALLARGFRFVGPTTCYSLMQAAGMVNDHTVDCFRHAALADAALANAALAGR